MDSATDGEDEWSWRELVWFVVVTVALHGAVVVLLNAGLALVERYGWFSEAKIQKKVQNIKQASQASKHPYYGHWFHS